MPPLVITRAEPAEADVLTAIAFAAKRHWGYPEAWVLRWAGVLTITRGLVAAQPTFVARENEASVGFYAWRAIGGEASLEHFWVVPSAMGRGVGRALFEHAVAEASAVGCHHLRIESDPHAATFYEHMGATRCGEIDATMDGQPRSLPLLMKPLR